MDGKQKTKKELKKEKLMKTKEEQEEERERVKMSNRQKEFYNWGCNLGRGEFAWDPAEAAEAFLQRDFPQLAKISTLDKCDNNTGQIFVPETWLSSPPAVADTVT